ncbi:MAG: porin [Methylobacter sp.]
MAKLKTTRNQPSKLISELLKGLAFISLGCFASISSAEPASAVKDLTGKDLSQLTGLDALGLDVGGWTALGYTFNPSHPVDRSNGPVQFNNRANEFNVHQLGLFIERAVDRSSQNWQLGGRFEAMFGTDTPNTQATGHWDSRLISPQDLRVYDIALPQAYVELYAPFGNGISTKIGHFYSILGYESVPSPPNLFVSHSYSMKSSPFTMTGVLTSYAVNDTLTVQAGAVTGPDNLDRYAGAWSFTGGFTLENQSHTRAFTFSILDGDVDDTQPSHLTYYYSMLRQDLTENFHFVLQHDYGQQNNAIPGQRAEWYSLVNYLTYDLNPEWSAGVRAEWFHDDDGTRFSTVPGSYYDVSAGVNWKPKTWLTIRPELRYDWADGIRPFDAGTRKDQFLLSLDAVVRF